MHDNDVATLLPKTINEHTKEFKYLSRVFVYRCRNYMQPKVYCSLRCRTSARVVFWYIIEGGWVGMQYTMKSYTIRLPGIKDHTTRNL